MTHQEKINWMILWAHKNKVVLELEGEVGFGRECVGILRSDKYPDYRWYDSDYNRIDKNGEVWTPPDAYHKHPCVAVLGRGEFAEAQLYDWLRYFDDNNFVLEETAKDLSNMDAISVILNGTTDFRIVKKDSI